jgi:hypothetical protein
LIVGQPHVYFLAVHKEVAAFHPHTGEADAL